MVGRLRANDAAVRDLRAEEKIVEIIYNHVEDEALPEEVEQCIAGRVPNLNEVISMAYMKAFQMTLGVLAGIVLLALLAASLIPNARAPSEAGGRST
jgi:hypothetical protein